MVMKTIKGLLITVSAMMALTGCVKEEVTETYADMMNENRIYEEYKEQKEANVMTAPVNTGTMFAVKEQVNAEEVEGFMPIAMRQHNVGKRGMKIVIMPEGFSCEEEEDVRLYRERAEQVADYIFSIEPMTSLRERFDVYCLPLNDVTQDCVNVQVSGDRLKTDVFSVMDVMSKTLTVAATEQGARTVETVPFYNGGSYVGEINVESIESVAVVLSLNGQGARARTFMEGTDFCASIIPVSRDAADPHLERCVQHEVCGHGVGLLADEYDSDGRKHENVFDEAKRLDEHHRVGMYLNADVHEDPELTPWRDFIGLEGYEDEGIGTYEGACGSYSMGVYRPTENSIMRDSHHVSEFNAPCRWFIFKRIIEHTEGYADFKTFLSMDAGQKERRKR